MSKNQPTHRIFAVSKPEGAEKATWREIGAAWRLFQKTIPLLRTR